MEGIVKVVKSNGYGFIETKDKIQYFFHHTQFTGNFKKLVLDFVKGEVSNVTFDLDPTATDGPRAINVKLKESRFMIASVTQDLLDRLRDDRYWVKLDLDFVGIIYSCPICGCMVRDFSKTIHIQWHELEIKELNNA